MRPFGSRTERKDLMAAKSRPAVSVAEGVKMILKTKDGTHRADNIPVLLDYLGIKKEAEGIQTVKGDIELIACVPFSINKEQGTNKNEGVAWTFSTFDLDRYHERIDPAGWDFSQFMKNPVIEWAHRCDIPAIGKAENIFVDENGLHGVIVFNDREYDPFGWSIGQRVKAGVIRAGSVGFRVMEIEIPSKADSRDGTSLIFRKQELLEFSICNVPANPFALAKGISNEKLAMSNERSVNASPFWNCLINNL